MKRIIGILLLALCCQSCLEPPEFYFDGSSQRPNVLLISNDAVAGPYEFGIRGQAEVKLSGMNLYAETIAVWFGEWPAQVATYKPDPTGKTLYVLSPPGPVGGGPVDVTVAHSGGAVTLASAYTYEVEDREEFAGEIVSLAIAGSDPTTFQTSLKLWNTVQPLAAGALLEPGNLYNMPTEKNQAELINVSEDWPNEWTVEPTLPSSDITQTFITELTLDPVGYSEVAPFRFTRNSRGLFDLCLTIDGVSPAYQPGISYDLTAFSSVSGTSIAARPETPPAITSTGQLGGIWIDTAGVAVVNSTAGVHITFEAQSSSPADLRYLVAEVGIYSPETSGLGQRHHLNRLVLQADDSLGTVTLDPEDLATLEVDTTCGILGRNLVNARILETSSGTSAEVEEREADYLAAGCVGIEDPVAVYPSIGYLRLSRHYLYRFPLDFNAYSCNNDSSCTIPAVLAVDLISTYEIPLSILPLDSEPCADGIDNDEDGFIDIDDIGCTSVEDTSESDETGFYLCDDGRDNDGDGATDYSQTGAGDPGCSSPTDATETNAEGPACDDGTDNDGDGGLDFGITRSNLDPGCSAIDDESEREAALICDDGIDNDNDGYEDFHSQERVGDPGCSSVTDTDELDTTGTWPCDDGLDTDLDGSLDQEDPGCRTNTSNPTSYTPYELEEYNLQIECDDSIDNDGDNDIDYRVGEIPGDGDCLSNLDDQESR